MARLDKSVYLTVLIFCWSSPQSASVSVVGQADEPNVLDEVSLLQASTFRKPSSKIFEAAAASESIRKVNTIMEQMQIAWAEKGLWSQNRSGVPDGCGLATPAEMQMPIPMWQAKNPGVDGFCFFSNIAYWFPAGQGLSYDDDPWALAVEERSRGFEYDKPSSYGATESSSLCAVYGTTDGPEVEINYDGIGFTWTHVRSCIDVTDDPYCYSLGWLKGQNLDEVMKTRNTTALYAKAKSECEKMQDEFQFVDQEVTVGRHVESTPVYFKKNWCSLDGSCPGVTRRTHAEHVYTKCQVGADSGHYAVHEMMYCYHRACVLEGNRVGHSSECRYEEDDD